MTPQDFDYLRNLLKDRSGLVLSAEKQYLAESRLLPLARRNGMSTLTELIGRLKAPQAAALPAPAPGESPPPARRPEAVLRLVAARRHLRRTPHPNTPPALPRAIAVPR